MILATENLIKPPNVKQHKSGKSLTTIRYALGKCSLGSILVASSDRGLCAISVDDDPDVLIRYLRDRFPKAELVDGSIDLKPLLARVVKFIETPSLGLDLPLDIHGTAFQQRVWQALQEIPLGTTVSYTDIAQRIGMPKAVRAVAGACAANSLAVVIPCHRVIRKDGDLSGFGWGVERKAELLRRERSV
jgi:AraC family transcriptional regulator, regulatory protein of adaptative response / methylated-DNA-[protein]-cysteine methyltransferase